MDDKKGVVKFRLLVLASLALAALCGFIVGSYAEPAKVEERVVIETVEVVKEVVRVEVEERIVERIVEVKVKDEKRKVTSKTTETTTSDGTTTKTTEVTIDTDTRTEEKSEKDTDKETKTKAEVEKESSVVVKVETEKIVTNLPNWRVTAKVGIDGGWLLEDGWRLPALSPVYGAGIDYRLIGTVWVGAWGLTNGSAGVGMSLEF